MLSIFIDLHMNYSFQDTLLLLLATLNLASHFQQLPYFLIKQFLSILPAHICQILFISHKLHQLRLLLVFPLLAGRHVCLNYNATQFELIILLMQGNFNINLPSIPSKVLKFKIQDVRMKGFSTKDARFKDDKEYLTKRFINSFANLQPKQKVVEETKSEPSTSLSSCFREEQDNYRWMVSDDKKNLLIKYEDHYKTYQPPLPPLDAGKQYSFPRAGQKDSLDYELKQYQSQIMSEDKSIDNYYFNMTEQSDQQSQDDIQCRRAERIQKKKHVNPSAAFKSEDRWKDKQRQIKNKIKVGPGSYILETIKHHSPSPTKKIENPEQNLNPKEKLKEFLKDYRDYKPFQSQEKKKEVVKKNSSCFAQANVDRFGNQIYPIHAKLNVPGPGSYETHGSLQQKAKRILILEEQRKLLRQWYNDGQ